MHEFIPSVSKYPPNWKWLRPFWGAAALTVRLPAVLATHRYDVVFLQRELISTFLTLEPLTKRPRVLDVDDAIFLHRGGRFVERLARQCDLIICGNDYLADRFRQWHGKVTVLPTAVDTMRYVPKTIRNDGGQQSIGWTGTSGNFKYLYMIETALKEVFQVRPDVRLRVIADTKPVFNSIAEERIDFIRWSPENEAEAIQGMSIGIMPLANSPWEKGKCSLKMLQYMACGVPVVVSPVGMNVEVLSKGPVGIGAGTHDEWVEALLALLSSTKERVNMGITGRKVVEESFSVDVIAQRLAGHLQNLAL